MICDAHVHVGYFPRKDGRGGEAYYFSPRRIAGFLRRSGVDECVFSSTNAIWDKSGDTMCREAMEMKRLMGAKAHAFFWIRKDYLVRDPNLEFMPSLYEGIKIHGRAEPWLSSPRLLKRIFSICSEKRMPIQIHTSEDPEDSPAAYWKLAKECGSLRIDFAHGRPLHEVCSIMDESSDVYVDVSFMPVAQIALLTDKYPTQVMYGSDVPAMLNYSSVSLGVQLRERLRLLDGLGELFFSKNFETFVNGRNCGYE